MTTIVADGIHLSSDSQVSSGILILPGEKKYTFEGGYLFCGTGVSYPRKAMIAWYLAGADPLRYPKVRPQDEFTFIVLHRTHAEEFRNDQPYADPCPYPYVAGSGHQVAIGAYHVCKSTSRAVYAACALDTMTNEPVYTVEIPNTVPITERKKRVKIEREPGKPRQ